MKNLKKREYHKPLAEVVRFSVDDVIAESDGPMKNVAQGKSKEFDYMNFFN